MQASMMSSNAAANANHPLGHSAFFGSQAEALKKGFAGISRAPECARIYPVCRGQGDDDLGMKRRDLVLGSTAALPFLFGNENPAWSAPILPPHLTKCDIFSPDKNAPKVDCCLKTTKATRPFLPPKRHPIFERPAAHLVSPAYTEKYIKAYELLKALPDDDNRKFINQAYIHCMYCGNVLYQPGADPYKADTDLPFDIHFSWLFLPWHRWYLYFHERILQKLLKDDTFRLPYWNWDNQSATDPLPNAIPDLYTKNSVLVDENRNGKHGAPAIVDLSWVPTTGERQDDLEKLRDENNAYLYQSIVSGAKTTSLFMGAPYRYGEKAPNSAGALENTVHGHVHAWTGSDLTPNLEDMGSLYSAAKDPIFYAHHANIDRLWVIWKTLSNPPRSDYTDPDFLNASFLFFDENGDPVTVYVRDALTTEALGYKYQPMPTPWTSAKAAQSAASSSTKSKLKARTIPEFGDKSAGKSWHLTDPFSSSIKLPLKKTGHVAQSDGAEIVLVIQDVEIPMDKFVSFDVFLNLPEADFNTSKNSKEFAGNFVDLPHRSSQPGEHDSMTKTVTIRLGIGETLEDLGIKYGDEFVVTLVPKHADDATIVIKGFDLEFE